MESHSGTIYKILSSFTILFIALVVCSPCLADVCDNSKNDNPSHFDISINAANNILFGSADKYIFTTVTPEGRWRFCGIDADSPYIAFGSPQVSNLNTTNPSASMSSQPTSLSHSNWYVSFGYAFKWSFTDAVPVIGIGFMNQEINKTQSTYDKGWFVFLGITVSAIHPK